MMTVDALSSDGICALFVTRPPTGERIPRLLAMVV